MNAKKIYILFFINLLLQLGSSQTEYFLKKFEKNHYTNDVNIITDICIDLNHRAIVSTPTRVLCYNGISTQEIEIPQSQKIISVTKNIENQIFILSTSGAIFELLPNEFKAKQIIKPPHKNKDDRFTNYTFLNGPSTFIRKIKKTNQINYNYFQTQSVFVNDKNAFLVKYFLDSQIYWLDTNLNKTYIKKKPKHKYYYHNKTLLFLKGENTLHDILNIEYKVKLPINIVDKHKYYLIHKAHQPLTLVSGEQIWILKQQSQQYYWELITQEFPKNTTLTCIAYDSLLNQYFLGTQNEGLLLLKEKKFMHLQNFNENDQTNYYIQIPASNQQEIISNGGKVCRPHQARSTQMHPLFDYHIKNNLFPVDSQNYFGNTNEEFILFNIKYNKIEILRNNLSLGGTNYLKHSKDTLFIASKDSFYFYEISTRKFTNIGPNTRSHLNIYRILNVKNHIWIASCSGIDIYDLKQKKFIHKLFNDLCIRELFPTQQGIIISCYGIGLKLINPQTYAIKTIPLDSRNSLRYVHCIIPSKSREIILPTNNGIIATSISNFTSSTNLNQLRNPPLYFDEYDGLPTNEFNGGNDPSYLKWGDSLISLASLKGIIQFNPNEIYKTQHHSIFDFKIIEILKNNKSLIFFDNIVHTPTFTEEINLKLSFTYWGNPSNLPLYYQYLNKEHPISIDSINNLSISLNHYGYENLTFYSKNGDQKNLLASIKIYRNPLWYKQFHIWLVILMIVWGLFFLYDRIKIIISELKTEKLEQIIKFKTQELNTINHTLEVKLKELEDANNDNAFYVSVINHDIFAPIKYINLVGQELTQHADKYRKTEIIDYLTTIINSTKRLEILCSNVLNHLMPNKEWRFEKNKVHFNLLITELNDFISLGIQMQQNKLICDVPNELYIETNKDSLHIILINLLSNSNRFTHHGLIKIFYHFNIYTQEHEIVVSDTGKGMNSELIEKINQKNLAISTKNNIDSQSYGIGYNLIFKMLEIISGRLEVQAGTNQGTIVTLFLPK